MATEEEKAAALAAIAAAMEKKGQERTGPDGADGGKEKTQPQKGGPRRD